MTHKRYARSRKVSDSSRKPPTSTEYFVPDLKGNIICVCSQAFRDVTCLSADRLQRVARIAAVSGLPKENRGGLRVNVKGLEITQSIIAHILRCPVSHHRSNKVVGQ